MSKPKKVVCGIIVLIFILLVLGLAMSASGQVLQLQWDTQVGNELYLTGMALALLILLMCAI